MKNNFDMDMWETHTNGNRWSTFIIAYPGFGVAYPNWWLNDGNYCGNGCLHWTTCIYACPVVVTNYYQNLEQIYTVGTTLNGLTATSRTLLFSDFQF